MTLEKTETFKKDSLVFSISKTKELKFAEILETGKTGIVFSTFPLFSLGQVLREEVNEYKKNMFFGIYRITQDLTVPIGRYSFRNMNPNRFFNWRGDFVPNVDVLPEENICHFENESNIFSDRDDSFILNKEEHDGELFITEEYKNVFELVEMFIVSYEKLRDLWKRDQMYDKNEMFGDAMRRITL